MRQPAQAGRYPDLHANSSGRAPGAPLLPVPLPGPGTQAGTGTSDQDSSITRAFNLKMPVRGRGAGRNQAGARAMQGMPLPDTAIY